MIYLEEPFQTSAVTVIVPNQTAQLLGLTQY